MKRNLKVIICSVCILAVVVIAGYQYNKYQKTELEIYDMLSNGTDSIYLHGDESLEFQRIFLHDINYKEAKSEDFSEAQEKWRWSVVYYPRSIREYLFHKDEIKEYEELLLNFDFYNDEDKQRFVVFGNIRGGENKYGFIEGEDYLYLQNILAEEKKE